MRKYVILSLVTVVLSLGLIAVVTQAQTAGSCTRRGTPERDVVTTGEQDDVICLLGGNDYAHSGRGNDKIRGGRGKDTLVGGRGRDTVKGSSNRDQLFGVDDRGGDVIVGGPGRDHCYIDIGDSTRGCEVVRVSISTPLTVALEDVLRTLMNIVEGTSMPSPVATVTQTETRTVTRTVSFPPCSPPPPEPPAPCT